MANRENFDIFGGADETLTLHARDSSNNVFDLTGMTIAWMVGKPPQDPQMRSAIITKTGTIVSASAGTFSVTVGHADTQDMWGEYLQQGMATDGSGNVTVVTQGRLKIEQLLDVST